MLVSVGLLDAVGVLEVAGLLEAVELFDSVELLDSVVLDVGMLEVVVLLSKAVPHLLQNEASAETLSPQFGQFASKAFPQLLQNEASTETLSPQVGQSILPGIILQATKEKHNIAANTNANILFTINPSFVK